MPFNAAKDTKIPSTDAWLSFIPVIVKFPPILNNPEFIENVTRLAAVIAQVLPTLNNAGNDNVVNAANDAATAPVILANNVSVTVVAEAHTGENPAPNVVNAGKLNVVNVAAVKLKAPVTVCKLVNVNDVNAARFGLNVPPTEVNNGILTVASNVPTGAKLVAIVVSAGILKVVNAFAVNE